MGRSKNGSHDRPAGSGQGEVGGQAVSAPAYYGLERFRLWRRLGLWGRIVALAVFLLVMTVVGSVFAYYVIGPYGLFPDRRLLAYYACQRAVAEQFTKPRFPSPHVTKMVRSEPFNSWQVTSSVKAQGGVRHSWTCWTQRTDGKWTISRLTINGIGSS
jgi:hypothetical protein